MYTKNVAVVGFGFRLVSKTTGGPITTGTVTGYVTRDGGTKTALAGAATHEGGGDWTINVTAAEMNGDEVLLSFEHSDAIGGGVTFNIHTTTESAASQGSTPAAVSGVTLLCSSSDVQWVWSEFGATSRLDDDYNGVEDSGLMSLGIQKASLDVQRYLIRRYSVAVIAASAWARWATAYFAAVAIGRRRGLTIPEDLSTECQFYREALERIQCSQDPLPGNDGPSIPRHDNRASVSNFTPDPRYARAKIRRVAATSTGPDQAQGLRRNGEQYPHVGYPWLG